MPEAQRGWRVSGREYASIDTHKSHRTDRRCAVRPSRPRARCRYITKDKGQQPKTLYTSAWLVGAADSAVSWGRSTRGRNSPLVRGSYVRGIPDEPLPFSHCDTVGQDRWEPLRALFLRTYLCLSRAKFVSRFLSGSLTHFLCLCRCFPTT